MRSATTLGSRALAGLFMLGAFGAVVVDDNSIDQWVGAYGTSLSRMMQ